jgi:hypothetical protein
VWNFKAIASASVPLLGRRWTLTNLLHRNAIITKELQAVLREDRVTMRFDEAEVFFVGCVKQMRQIVLQAVDSLPHKVNPADPQLAREALHEWVRCASCTRALMAQAQKALR